MEMIEYKLSAPKEVLLVGQCLNSILKATAVALEDGWTPGTDIPAIIAASLGPLALAIGGLQALPEEFRAEAVKSAMGIVNPIMEGVDELLKVKK